MATWPSHLVTYQDKNVLTAAKERLHHIFDIYDSVVVAFSGGKDSLAVLELVREVSQERCKLDQVAKVHAIFRDEELIPDAVIDFVDKYRREPWLDLKWFAVPLASSKFILGKTFDYVQWDPARAWVREKPEWAITSIPGFEGQTFDQYSMDAAAASYFPGKVCMLTGIRCDESLIRFRAIVNKKNEAMVCGSSTPRLMLGRPIYDWSENDIFRYFYEREITYCSIYDWQHVNQEGLRVSTPLHAEAAKRMQVLKTRDPGFFNRILQVFPEVGVQALYYKDIDQDAILARYPRTWEGVEMLINEQMTDPEQLKKALWRLPQVKGLAMKKGNEDVYPIDYVMKYFLSGVFKRMLLPKPR